MANFSTARSNAAPTEDTLYDVYGDFIYYMDGVRVVVPLFPDTITVMPDPKLVVHYFLQRHIIGDDPFTKEVEPSVPATLAVMISNTGYGVARNMIMSSGQPEIIENDKGLLVGFQLSKMRVDNEEVSCSSTKCRQLT